MNNLRVLVFSATFGAGHVRAAEALIEAIRAVQPTAVISHLDCVEILSKSFNNVLKDFYIAMLKHTPKLWGKFYYGTSRIAQDSFFQNLLNNAGRTKYLECIDSFQPDLIICTYPTIAGILAQLRLEKILQVPVAVVITDYAIHSQWIHTGVDLYIVGGADILTGLVARGIDPDIIRVTGIPVSPKFEGILNRAEIVAKLGLQPDLPTCLIMGGAYGVLSDMKELCRIVADVPIPSQSMVVCGQDENLYKSLDDLMENTLNPILRFGFVNNVEELMTVSDLVITKAGALTVTEALTKGLPIIVFKPIPGQEMVNALYLKDIGAGQIANSQSQLKDILHNLLQHPEYLESMRQSAALAIPGRAADRAVQYMLKLIGPSAQEAEVG